MKKIIIIAAMLLTAQGALLAQSEKAVAEKDVKVNYVKDFQKQVKDATDIHWFCIDSLTYKVRYTSSEQEPQAMVFSNRGSETLYYVALKDCPHAIKDTVSHLYPKHTLREAWVRKMRGKFTYQARIAKRSGFLWWKKDSDPHILNFEIDGKYINVQ